MTATPTTQPPVKISGPPLHPLVSYLRKAAKDRERALATWSTTAKMIHGHHIGHGTSSQGVYAVSSPQSWKYLGPAEDHGHLLTQVGYFAVADRAGDDKALALQLAGFDHPAVTHAENLHTAAHAAAPMIACALGLRTAADTLVWDTGETVSETALRLARDEAWCRVGTGNPVLPRPRDIFTPISEALATGGPAAVSMAYLAVREAIEAALTRNGIEWGGPMLTAEQAADRACLAWSTWRSHVSRGQAPTADRDGAWRAATVDAWLLSRPRVQTAGW